MKPEGQEPRALRGAGLAAALGWVCAVVLLYLAVSELGVRVVP